MNLDHAWTWLLKSWLVQHPGLWVWNHADRIASIAALLTAGVTAYLVILGRRQLRLTQRAWITVKSVTFADYDAPLKIPHITIVLQNTGPTPANQVITSIESTKRTRPRLSGRMPRLDWRDPQWGTVGPNGRVTYLWHYGERNPKGGQLHHYRLNPQDVDDLMHNRLFLFVYGETRYRDIFGKRHRTTWCWYNPNPHGNEPRTRQANVWNEAR
jgi:hypothetical protein